MKTRKKILPILAGVCFMSALAAVPAGAGETVEYNASRPGEFVIRYGDGQETRVLQEDIRSENNYQFGPAVAPRGGNKSNSVSGNTVTVNGDGGATLKGNIYGAMDFTSDAAGAAVKDNSVLVKGGAFTIEEDIYGGVGWRVPVTGNTVTVSGITMRNTNSNFIVGGYGQYNNVTDNHVTVSDSMIGDEAVTTNIYGGTTPWMSDATGNTVNISDSDIRGGRSRGIHEENDAYSTDGYGTEVHGGFAFTMGNARDNTVTISNSRISNSGVEQSDGSYSATSVFGGNTMRGNATGNTVNVINGSDIRNDGKGYTNVYGGFSSDGHGRDNTVNISDSAISGNDVTNVYGSIGRLNDVTGNTVNISDSTISGGNGIVEIYGGWAVGGGNATGNTVNISGNTTITGNGTITLAGGGGSRNEFDYFSRNTLNLKKTQPLTVDVLKDFEYMNFYLSRTQDPYKAILTVTEQAQFGNGGGKTKVKVFVEAQNNVTGNIILLDAPSYIDEGSVEFDPYGGSIIESLSDIWRIAYNNDIIFIEGDKLMADLNGVSFDLSEKTRELPKSHLAALGMVNRGVDLASTGIPDTKGVFARINGGVSGYANSDVDITGVSLFTGVSGNSELNRGRLTYAGFFSGGRGSYETSGTGVSGEGDSGYAGLGAFVRLDFNGSETGDGHPYAEAHVQGGQAKADFFTGDIRIDNAGMGYETSSSYVGGHIGGGYIRNIGERGEIDLYAKYLHTSVDGDNVMIASDSVSFESATSRRLRVGGRYTRSEGNFRPYVEAAWENESGEVPSVLISGYPVTGVPEVSGGTGILGLGFTYAPPDSRLRGEFGLRGYTGERDGVTGTLRVEYDM
ncbi:MAG: autotransporter outer membrane beta-barrel domain-containing protein [Synergistaceae bacterium]|jgi:hypothetical protein|nr:autotransporter outer membrane beta-barrel domain-containing protein [Synergistaceae bacterium]